MLFIDGELVVNNTDWQHGQSFFGLGSAEITARREGFVSVDPTRLEVRSWASAFQRSSGLGLCGGVRIGAAPVIDEEAELVAAEQLAARSDKVIVMVGLNEDFETEGHDRELFALPGQMDTLVCRVLAIRPDAIIINQSGMPVEMPWAQHAATVVQVSSRDETHKHC